MEQRPLRLGDIVDDYCPRERRITNHAIVAIVEQSIRQTRCTTCDAEHVYKDGKAPRRRKGEESSGADQPIGQIAQRPMIVETEVESVSIEAVSIADEPPSMAASADDEGELPESDAQPQPGRDEFWPAHRTLIRASLPRTEGEQPPPRPIPEFTMHQRPAGRGQHFRGSWNGNGNGNGHFRHGRPQGEVNGNTIHGHGGNRHGGGQGQPGQGRGHGGGQGHGGHGGNGQGHPGGGRPGGRHRHRGGRHKQSR